MVPGEQVAQAVGEVQEHAIERAVVLAEGETLCEADLLLEERAAPGDSLPVSGPMDPPLPLGEVERRYVPLTLQRAGWNP